MTVWIIGGILAALVTLYLTTSGAFTPSPPSGSDGSNIPLSAGGASGENPPSVEPTSNALRDDAGPEDAPDSADEEWIPIPLDEIRYGGFLKRSGIKTESHLASLSHLTEVDGIGADRGADVAEDLIDEGVDRSIVPPVTK